MPRFKVYSGMDLPYWQEFYLLGEAEELAERIRGKIEALGGCEWVVLNPLDWGTEQLELWPARCCPEWPSPSGHDARRAAVSAGVRLASPPA